MVEFDRIIAIGSPGVLYGDMSFKSPDDRLLDLDGWDP
jgi:hypothetical protein